MKYFIAAIALSTSSLLANASIITIGSLSRDTSNNNYISDSLNNRTWMGWDKTFGYTLAETIAQTGVGGVFEGFSVAHTLEAMQFVNALVGENSCSDPEISMCSIKVASPGNLNLLGVNYGSNNSKISFLNDNDPIPGWNDAAWLRDDEEYGYDYVNYYDYGIPISVADNYSINSNPAFRFGYLLYRDNVDVKSVPEPSTSALLGLAAIALIWSQRRRLGKNAQ